MNKLSIRRRPFLRARTANLLTVIAIVASIITTISCQSALCAPETPKGAVTIRKFSFPKAALGSLSTVNINKACYELFDWIPGCAAVGNVAIRVGPNQLTGLTLNGAAFHSPALIDASTANQIDGFKLQYMNMDDNGVSYTDGVLPHLNGFQHIKLLILDGSDVSDAGLLKMKPMPELRRMNAPMSGLTGSFLAHANYFPLMRGMVLFNCPLKPSYLKDLKNLPELRELDIRHTEANIESIRALSQCHKLEKLKLSSNPHTEDDSMGLLTDLKNLRLLELDSTKVSFVGLKKLKPLASTLKSLNISQEFRIHDSEIHKLFPSCQIKYIASHGTPSEELKTLAAPIPY